MSKANIEESKIYKTISSDEYIYRAIHALDSYVFEKDHIEYDDYNLMLSLNDPFDSITIVEVIQKVRTRIREVIVGKEFLDTKVYFKIKKFTEQGVEYRPIHSTSLIDLITCVVLLNVLLFDVSNGNSMELSELAVSLPSNFYGNIPSNHPKHLFKPWYVQFKNYTEDITDAYNRYLKSKEFKYEISLDLKNFFPSIDPIIVLEDVLIKYSTKYVDNEFECFKIIVCKLLFLKVQGMPAQHIEDYYGRNIKNISVNSTLWTVGIPQGLPQSYFFGNLCMKKVARIFKNHFGGENHSSYYYVDDSVIYTNTYLDKKTFEAIKLKINDNLKDLNIRSDIANSRQNSLKLINDTNIYIDINKGYKYSLRLNNEKCDYIEIKNQKFGQMHLNAYSRLASMVSIDIYKIFSESEEMSIINRLRIINEAIEKEVDRVKKYVDDGIDSNYLKILTRFKKFFKYRYKILDSSFHQSIPENIVNFLKVFEINPEDARTIKNFFEVYDEDILLNELRYYLKNFPEYHKEILKQIARFNDSLAVFSDKNWGKGIDITCSYLHVMCSNITTRKNQHDSQGNNKYASTEKMIGESVRYIGKVNDKDKKSVVNYSIDFFRSIKNGEANLKQNPIGRNLDEVLTSVKEKLTQSIYKYIGNDVDELFRISLNTFFSGLFQVELNDLMNIAKKDKRPLYYNEARLLLFVRNKHFRLSDFYEKFQDFTKGNVLDYSLFEAVNYFRDYLHDPILVDNLVLTHKYTSDFWKNGSKFLHFYTLHNHEHAIEVIKSIVKFIKNTGTFNLSNSDFYILFISCYLHDIALVIHPNLIDRFVSDEKNSNVIYSDFINNLLNFEDKSHFSTHDEKFKLRIDEQNIKRLLVDIFVKMDNFYENDVRDNHPKNGSYFIRDSKDLNFIDEYVREIIADVSYAHGQDVKSVYNIKKDSVESKINRKYLKILLRIGDLLDMSSNRISNVILDNNMMNMSKISRFHWLSHKAVSEVEIKVDYSFAMEQPSNSFIAPNSIIEQVKFVIYLEYNHVINVHESRTCNQLKKCYLNAGGKGHKNLLMIGEGISCFKCDFMMEWMSLKNEYLYKELHALQVYLNRLEGNIFKTELCVEYVFNKEAKKLSVVEFETISNFITG